MHRFDGLDLLCLLIGLSLLALVVWAFLRHGFATDDPEPSQYLVGIDYGKSRPEAQMMLYQLCADGETYALAGSDNQAEAVYQEVHDEIERMWIEYGFRIKSKPPYDWAQEVDA